MNSFKRFLAALTIAVLLPAVCPRAMGESYTVYVSRESAKVYDISGSELGRLSVNTKLKLTGMKGDICRVSRDGKTAYMKKSDLSKSPMGETAKAADAAETAETSYTVYVARDGAKVYDSKGKALGKVARNTKLTCTGVRGDVCRVMLNGKTGYMSKGDLSESGVEVSADVTLKSGDTGEAVKKVQKRLKALGYFSGEIGGNYQSLTKAAVEAFQKTAGLSVDGECGVKTLQALFSDSAPKMPQTADLAAATSKGGTSSKSTTTPAHGTAIEMDWWTSDIQNIFARGATATITDVETGLSWREQRRGGINHADVQPLTAADTAVLKKVYGGAWSWNRRAIFVTIDGVNYAASMNGMPHGGGSISGNNFNGHHCIHFTNSRTHGSNKVCSLHQGAIKKALAAKL